MKKIGLILLMVGVLISARATTLDRQGLLNYINNRLTLENVNDRVTIDDFRAIFEQLTLSTFNLKNDSSVLNLTALDTLKVNDVYFENDVFYLVYGNDTISTPITHTNITLDKGGDRSIKIEEQDFGNNGANLTIEAGADGDGYGGGNLILRGGGTYSKGNVEIGSTDSIESAIVLNDSVNAGQFKITNLGEATNNNDAITLGQVNSIISNTEIEMLDTVFLENNQLKLVRGNDTLSVDMSGFSQPDSTVFTSELTAAMNSAKIDTFFIDSNVLYLIEGTDTTTVDLSGFVMPDVITSIMLDSILADYAHRPSAFKGLINVPGTDIEITYPGPISFEQYDLEVSAWYPITTSGGDVVNIQNGIKNLVQTTTGFTCELSVGTGKLRYRAWDSTDVSVMEGLPPNPYINDSMFLMDGVREWLSSVAADIEAPGPSGNIMTSNGTVWTSAVPTKTVYSLTLPYATTVAGRISAATQGVDYPTGWTLTADGLNIIITHGLSRWVSSVTVFAKTTGTQRQQLFNTAAFNGITCLSDDATEIFSLSTIAKPIVIYLIFE